MGGISFSHDARGNLTHDGSRTLGYDLENRLLTVSGPTSLNLSYGPAGRLRQSVAGSATTQFLYSGSALVAEYDGAGNVLRRYVHGPGVDEPIVWYEGAAFADPRYLIADRQGSIIATRGASTVRHKYGPYGEPDAWAGSRFRYTGQIALPEAGLYHYKARVYDPALGRFLQTDPVGYDDDVNLYAYVGNNPVDFRDSSGNGKKWVGWWVELSGTGMRHVAKVTKEQAVRLREQEKNFLGRSYQKAREVEVAAHGEKSLVKHAAHKDGHRPHLQTEGKRGHSFWSVVATATGVAAVAVDKAAEAADRAGAFLEDYSGVASDVVSALDPLSLLTSGEMEPPPGFTEGAFGMWIKQTGERAGRSASAAEEKEE